MKTKINKVRIPFWVGDYHECLINFGPLAKYASMELGFDGSNYIGIIYSGKAPTLKEIKTSRKEYNCPQEDEK